MIIEIYALACLSFGVLALITVHLKAYKIYRQYIADENKEVGINAFIGASIYLVINTIAAPVMLKAVLFDTNETMLSYAKALISTSINQT